jgi:hypothetical protein
MQILNLPEELLHSIISFLPHEGLLNFNLLNRQCYNLATPLLWREVELVDCRSTRPRVRKRGIGGGDGGEREGEGKATARSDQEMLEDEHDDSPIIAKLLIILV